MSGSIQQAATVLGASSVRNSRKMPSKRKPTVTALARGSLRSDNGETFAEINPAHRSCIVSGFSLFAGELAKAVSS